MISRAGATLSVLFRTRLRGSGAVRGSFAFAQSGQLTWGRGLASAPCLLGTEYLPAAASCQAHKRIVTGTQISGSKSTPFTSLSCLQACVWRVNPGHCHLPSQTLQGQERHWCELYSLLRKKLAYMPIFPLGNSNAY